MFRTKPVKVLSGFLRRSASTIAESEQGNLSLQLDIKLKSSDSSQNLSVNKNN